MIFSKEHMWEVAKNTLGLECVSWDKTKALVVYSDTGLEELYMALKDAHEKKIEEYEWRMMR